MRVGYVTQWFPPEPGTVVPAAIATGLVGLGHQVEVLTGFPNYPSGTLMPGYPLRPYRRDTGPADVTVHRAPLFPSHSASAIPRAANYLSFAAAAAAVGRAAIGRPDVWLVYSSPATAALPAFCMPRRHRAPVFLLIQDLWPDSVTGSGFMTSGASGGVEKALSRFCSWTYDRAAGIGVISPGMRQLLVARGVPNDKIFDTPNWIDDDHLHPDLTSESVERGALGLPEGRLWMYAGNFGELQGLDALIRAFASRPRAQLALVGDGVARERLGRLAADLGATNVRVFPQQPVSEIGRYIAASDVQIVSLQDTPLLRVTMPSKVQTAMAAARPILVHAGGDAADVVVRAGAGWRASPGSVEELVAAIDDGLDAPSERLSAMGLRSRAVFVDDYSSAVGPPRLAAALEQAMARGTNQA